MTLNNIDNKRMEATTRLNEIFEIHSQLKNHDKRTTDKAVQDLRKSEQEVQAAEREIGMFHTEAPNMVEYQSAREGGETPTPSL